MAYDFNKDNQGSNSPRNPFDFGPSGGHSYSGRRGNAGSSGFGGRRSPRMTIPWGSILRIVLIVVLIVVIVDNWYFITYTMRNILSTLLVLLLVILLLRLLFRGRW